jgi:methylmalonyl-CoA mutase N-terminal domain/subunit
MGVHNNFFEEVAKYRAARRMWARIMKDRFGATNPKAWRFRVHAQENASTSTAQQPYANMVRGTVQAMAAVLGGVQSLQVNPFDEALAIPTEDSNRLALRTQQILAHESGLTDVVDPLGGSYYVEWLTDHVESEAKKILDQLETWGEGSMLKGVLHGIEIGYFEDQITDEAYAHQCAVEAGEKVVVGVNKFTDGGTAQEIALTRVGPELEALQKQRLSDFKARRDDGEVAAALEALRRAAAGDDNVIPPLRRAVRAGATLGECCALFRETFGLWRG